MNWRKFVSKAGTAITLLGLTLATKTTGQTTNYILVGIIGIDSLIMLFENISKNKIWKSIIVQADSFDFTYIGFGLGLFKLGVSFAANSSPWPYVLTASAGLLFVGSGIGSNIMQGYNTVVTKDPRMGFLLGILCLVYGFIKLVMDWSLILNNPKIYADVPVLLIFMGFAFMFIGWKRWKNKQITENLNKKKNVYYSKQN